MSISQRAVDVRASLRTGKVGMFVDTGREQIVTSAINDSPQSKKIGTITVSTAANGTDYTVNIGGIPIVVNSGSSATKATIAAAIALAINSDPIVRGLASAESDGVDTVTVTGLWPNVPFDMSTDDANLTVAETVSAAGADAVPFGRFVVFTGHGSTPERETFGALAKTSLFTAQVDTHKISHVASAIYPWSVTVDGETYTGNVAVGADAGATATAIAAAINGALPANTVAATTDGADLVLTSELAGRGFVSTVGNATKTSTNGPGTDVNRSALGFALFAYDEEGEEYPGNAGMRVARRGSIWVDFDGTPDYGAPVYVDLSSSNAGRVYATGGANRTRLRDCSWGRVGGDGLVEVIFDFTRAA